jgi:hypothetical protein
MVTVTHSPTPKQQRARRDGRGSARARSWTGRAVVSCSTDSLVPKRGTIATHRTRVSEMRLLPRTGPAFGAKDSKVPAPSTVERRDMGIRQQVAAAP